VVTRQDELGRKTVYDVLPEWVRNEGWQPVGRLDRDSRGLLLFVEDPSLIDKLTKPDSIAKIYDVWVRGHVNNDHLVAMKSGVETPIGILQCAEVEILGIVGPKTHLRVTLFEGKNRQIRRIFGALLDSEKNTPLKVLELKRTHFGSLELDVPSGQWRFLNANEIEKLKELR
ncbi:MAG TPA: pseudouridine synthase, partial [Acidobacteriota bacterium]